MATYCFDNALCESFFASLECELLDRYTFRSHQEARQVVCRYIEGWYNTQRRHSAIDYESPINYERIHSYIVYPESPSLSTKAG